jgi:hypothetical protein
METERDNKGWNPYVAGALTGLLLVFSVWFTGEVRRGVHNLRQVRRLHREDL